MIQEKQLKVTEIQVPFQAYHLDKVKNLRHLLNAFHENLTTLSIEEDYFTDIVKPIDLSMDFPVNTINLNIWHDTFFTRYNFSGQSLSAPNLSIQCSKPLLILPHLKHFNARKTLSLTVDVKSFDQLLKHFDKYPESDRLRQVDKVLIQERYEDPIVITGQQREAMDRLRMTIRKSERRERGRLDVAKELPMMHHFYGQSSKIIEMDLKGKAIITIRDVIDHLKAEILSKHQVVLYEINPQSITKNIEQSKAELIELIDKIAHLEPEFCIKRVDLSCRTTDGKGYLNVVIELEDTVRQNFELVFTVNDLPESTLLSWDISSFIKNLPQLKHIQTFGIDCRADKHLVLNKMTELTNAIVKDRGQQLKKFGFQFMEDIPQSKRGQWVYKSKEFKEYEEGLEELKENIVNHCSNLEKVFLSNNDKPNLLSSLGQFSLGSTLPNLNILKLPRSFDDFDPFAEELNKHPDAKLNPNLTTILVRNMLRPHVHLSGKIFKTLACSLKDHVNSGQKIVIQSGDDEIDVDEYAEIAELCEPMVEVDCRTITFALSQDKYPNELKRWQRIAQVMEDVKRKY
ncbi:hypothetical protein FGO68_gene4487 [Halteria grandinella]|uniref:Uncharacterized protein n=1 Tax=Halteria grandinella TaxID=5974 RepID=A0A8J8NWI1_HALGN|nr:hypothetical protein FGO68_gene4487 [Halteria grandinella]